MDAYFLLEKVTGVLLAHQYNMALVLLSIGLMVFSAYTTLRLLVHLRRFAAANARSFYPWWIATSSVFGGGVFAMHFIAMLAFSTSVDVSYDLGMTLLSLLIVMFVSALGIYQVSRQTMHGFALMMSAIMMGVGIALMHYVGMEAVIAPMLMLYKPGLWILSIIVAVVVSAVALFIFRYYMMDSHRVRPLHKLGVACVMAIGASGMHYTGMMATAFYTGGSCGIRTGLFNVEMAATDLAMLVAFITLILLVVAMAASTTIEHFHFMVSENSQEIQELVDARTSELMLAKAETDMILNSLQEAVLHLDQQGHIQRINPNVSKMLGYLEYELVGQPVRMLFASDEQDDQFFESTIIPLVTSPLQRAYDNDQDAFFIAVQHAPIAVVIIDEHEHILSFNRAAEELLGFKKSDVIYKSVHHIIPEHMREQHSRHVHTAVISGTFARTHGKVNNIPSLCHDGSMRAVDMHLMAMRMADTPCVLALMCASDENCWDTLQASELGSMILDDQSSDDMASLTNLQGKNGNRVPVLVSGSSLIDEVGQVRGAVLMFNDVRKYLQVVEEKEQAMQSLVREQQQRLDSLVAMAAGISHDFNNLLVPIIGNVELVQSSLVKGSVEQRCMEDALSAAMQASRISQQMLSYTGNTVSALRKPVSLSRLFLAMQHTLHAMMPKHVDVAFDVQENLPVAKLDPIAFEQVLLNLVTNAAESMEKQAGHIEVATLTCDLTAEDLQSDSVMIHDKNVQPGAFVGFVVRDHGCGISNDDVNKVFDPFFSTKFTGRGLGLSVVLGTVKAHKGVIFVSSEVGKGSSFTVLVPQADDQSSAMTKPIFQAVSTNHARDIFKQRNVLVVDDDEMVRVILSTMLKSMGIAKVFEAENGLQGVNVYREHLDASGHSDIDVVVLDMMMPVMSGAECLKHLLALHPHVKVLLSSGYSTADIEKQINLDVLAGVLPKPYNAEALKVALAKALDSGDFAI